MVERQRDPPIYSNSCRQPCRRRAGPAGSARRARRARRTVSAAARRSTPGRAETPARALVCRTCQGRLRSDPPPTCRAAGSLRPAARRWVCRDAGAGIKGLAVGACQTRRMPPTTPLWTLPTPPRERPRCCVTRAAFSAASTSSPPAWQTPQLPPSDPSAKHATLSRGSSQNWCMRSTPSVAPPSKRSAGVASASPRDGVLRAARNRSRKHHGGLHRHVNMAPNAAAGHADSPPSQRAAGLSVEAANLGLARRHDLRNLQRDPDGARTRPRAPERNARSHRDRALSGRSSHADR